MIEEIGEEDDQRDRQFPPLCREKNREARRGEEEDALCERRGAPGFDKHVPSRIERAGWSESCQKGLGRKCVLHEQHEAPHEGQNPAR
ncbi:MAG: hypothetical protein AB7I50_02650 [Vicinamibacterales bacterium]